MSIAALFALDVLGSKHHINVEHIRGIFRLLPNFTSNLHLGDHDTSVRFIGTDTNGTLAVRLDLQTTSFAVVRTSDPHTSIQTLQLRAKPKLASENMCMAAFGHNIVAIAVPEITSQYMIYLFSLRDGRELKRILTGIDYLGHYHRLMIGSGFITFVSCYKSFDHRLQRWDMAGTRSRKTLPNHILYYAPVTCLESQSHPMRDIKLVKNDTQTRICVTVQSGDGSVAFRVGTTDWTQLFIHYRKDLGLLWIAAYQDNAWQLAELTVDIIFNLKMWTAKLMARPTEIGVDKKGKYIVITGSKGFWRFKRSDLIRWSADHIKTHGTPIITIH